MTFAKQLRAKFSLILAIMMVMSMIMSSVAAGANSATTGDYQNHWASTQINDWLNKGLVSGYEDGSFKPDDQIKRSEFFALVNRAFGFTDKAQISFTDVAPDAWFADEIAKAMAAGYISGYSDGTIRPDQAISRQEVAVILASLLKLDLSASGEADPFKDSAGIAVWSKASVAAVVTKGFMNGYPDGTYQPEASITRAEAVVTLDRSMKEAAEAPKQEETQGLKGAVTLNGKPVEGALVRLQEKDGYAAIDTAVTGKDGSYSFAVKAGTYDLTVTKEDYVSYKSDVTVAAVAPNTQDFSLVQGVQLSGQMYDKNRNQIGGAEVFFTTNPTFEAVTDESGKFTVYVLPDRTYTVRSLIPGIEDQGYEVIASDIQVKQTSVDLGTLKSNSAIEAPVATNSSSSKDDDDDDDHDSGSGNENENPNAAFNGAPQAFVNGQSTDSIFAAEPVEVTFRVTLTDSDAASVTLNKVNESNQVVSEVAALYDDGDASHGDSIQSDGIYSGTTTLNESAEGYIRLQASTGSASSGVLKLSIVNHLTDEQLTKAVSMSDDTQDKLDQLIAQYGDTHQAKDETVEWLESQPEVESAGISGSEGSIWYVLDSGILGGISAAPQNSKGLSPEVQIASSGDVQQQVSALTLGQTGTSVGSKRVAVISPFAGELGTASVYDAVYDEFDEADYPFEAERVKNAAADVDFFKQLKNYGVVVLDTHGDTFYDEHVLEALHEKYGMDFQYAGPQVIFLTGEQVNSQNKQEHELDLKKGRLAIISGYYAITPSFITRYNDSMPETIVFNGSCRSLYNNSMADAFINNGAQTYYGYTDYVQLTYDQAIVQSVFDALINEDKTTEEAFQEAVAAHGENDGLASFAMKGSSIGVKTDGVLNGTFEDGTWNGWNGTGDVRVISQLGSLKPTEGSYMAIISTGLGFENNDFEGYEGEQEGGYEEDQEYADTLGFDEGTTYDYNSNSYIEQNFVIPEGVETLSFDYNFISEEPTEFVDSIFDDTFKATVTSSVYDVYDEHTLYIATESINGSQEYWVEENKVDIDFYGGDLTSYMTNWKHVEYDVSEFAGKKPVILRFHVWDQGDSVYDTAVLIDNIKLQ